MANCDVAIIGAGPYGLAATTHLRTIPGLEVRVFGKPMSFWENNMPKGMFLRSGWEATHIADPDHALTLEAFQAAKNIHFTKPVPLDRFVQYGQWYQCQAVPDLDHRKVVLVERNANGFRISLSDGEMIHSHRVVVACGIESFAWCPPEFRGLDSSLVTHASVHKNFSPFTGKRVLAIGSGQSSLESAALLHESDAEVEVFGRADHINWLQGWASTALHWRLGSIVRKILYAHTDVGPAGISQLMARPDLLRLLPRWLQNKLWKRSVRPAGARWLVKRLEKVPIHLGCSATSVATVGERVKVRFNDGTERLVHHVLLGTGYRVDITKYDFLAPELVQSIQRINGYPVLQPGLETSVPGLHIVGAPAAWSFGPLMQFVSGTHFTSQALIRHIGGKM